MSDQQFSQARRHILLPLQKRSDQITRKHTRTYVGRARDNLGLVHTKARELHRKGSLFPLILRKTGNPHDGGKNVVEVLVELIKRHLQKIGGGTCATGG